MDCPDCRKPAALCLCGSVPRLANRIPVLILQHPQEPDKELGSAYLATSILANSRLRTALSVPRLEAAWPEATEREGWIVLYLGSKYKFRAPADGHARIVCFDRDDQPVERDPASVRGIVAIDGTWAQAKALWWRNPWLLKLTRAAVIPGRPSLYGSLRREPRAECVSTIEAVAAALEALGEEPAVPEALRAAFAELVGRYAALHGEDGAAARGAAAGTRPAPVKAPRTVQAAPPAAAPDKPRLTRAERAAAWRAGLNPDSPDSGPDGAR